MKRFIRLLLAIFILMSALGLPKEKATSQTLRAIQFKSEQKDPHWYSDDWACRLPILVCNNMSSDTLLNTAVRIALNDDNFCFDLAKIDGSDIRFTNSDGMSELYYWIEEYDNVCKVANLWVRIPDFPDSLYKAIYMYYGNPAALSVANEDSTFMYFHEDFSSLIIDWENVWDTDNGDDLSRNYYRVDKLSKGYLVHDRKSYYSDSINDYYKQQVNQIIRPYSDHGFWDSNNRNWIRALRWNSADGWTTDIEQHDWGYSAELEEGALMAALVSSNTEMDSLLALELEYMINNVDSTGALQNLDVNQRAESYGRVLSALALGSMHFKDHDIYGNLALAAFGAMNLMYSHISKNLIQSQRLLLSEVIILRGFANAVRAFNIYGMKDIGTLAQKDMETLCQKMLSMQRENGFIHVEADVSGRVQNQLKIDIALELASGVNGEKSYLEAVNRNLGWIIDNRFDRHGTGGIEWPPGPVDGDPFFEVHQTWFMIAAKYLCKYSHEYNYLDELSQSFAFLTDDNYAHVDMYEHNSRNYDAFFSYRVMERNGVIQDESSEFKTFKGSYEIGASLWALALNYDTYNPGYARLTSQVPCDVVANLENGGMFTQERIHGNNISWEVRFRNPTSAGMYSGLFQDKQGSPIILFDSKNGLNYIATDNSLKIVYSAQLIRSRATYTVKIFKATPDNLRIILLENGNEVANVIISDVEGFDSYYFGIFKESQGASDAPASFFIDNIHADQYVYSEPSIVPCPEGFISLTAPQSLDIPVGTSEAQDHYLSGFTIKNVSNTFLSLEYDVISKGKAVLNDNNNPTSLHGITPLLSPGESYSPPDAKLIIPMLKEEATQNTIYRVSAVQCSDIIDSCISAISFKPDVRLSLALYQNYPNPFNPRTVISFTLPESMHVELAIFNSVGDHIKTLLDTDSSIGFKEVIWDGTDSNANPVASGVYFYRLNAGQRTMTRKMVLLK